MAKEQRHYSIHKVPGAHLTWEHRLIIQKVWNKNCELKHPLSIRQVALRLGLAPSTLYDELARGCVTPPKRAGMRPDRFPSYSALTAQKHCNQCKGDHGPRSKVTTTVSKLLTHYIRDKRMSPETAVYHLKQEHGISLCHKTVYNYIHSGLLAVSDDDLLRGCQPRRSRSLKRVVSKTCKEGHLINDIPNKEGWDKRQEFGHWEMDTVHSATGKRGGLLVLIERKTRYYLCAKLPRLTQACVHKALKKLFKSGRIIEMKSLLTDNGCEFLDIAKITSIIQSNLYYTHAYASCEKGSVEHANGLLRFHFPKGTDFSKVRPERIAAAEAAINNTYRRTSLNGTTASQAYLANCPAA